MNLKIIGAAVAAALLGLAGASYAQGTGGSAASSSSASGQDTPREAGAARSGPGSAAGGSGAVMSGSGTTTTAPATTGTASRCDTLTGAEKTRCMRDERASSGTSSAGVPVTKNPGDSGPGAVDKTHPGGDSMRKAPADAGTSSAGSSGGK